MSFQVEVITLVPELWPTILGVSSGLVGQAFNKGLASLTVTDLREFGLGKHRQVDDTPFGGGPGMVLRAEPLWGAIEQARTRTPGPVVLLSPRGTPFSQSLANRWAQGPGLCVVCGRYEGIDQRIYDAADEVVSLGDYVLSAGDPAAWCLIDAVVRLRPGVLGNAESLQEESFSGVGLEYPQYTKPAEFRGAKVPEVLRSGDHGAIARWREEQALAWTQNRRPELLKKRD